MSTLGDVLYRGRYHLSTLEDALSIDEKNYQFFGGYHQYRGISSLLLGIFIALEDNVITVKDIQYCRAAITPSEDVQYCVGGSVLFRRFSAVGGYHEYFEGIPSIL